MTKYQPRCRNGLSMQDFMVDVGGVDSSGGGNRLHHQAMPRLRKGQVKLLQAFQVQIQPLLQDFGPVFMAPTYESGLRTHGLPAVGGSSGPDRVRLGPLGRDREVPSYHASRS